MRVAEPGVTTSEFWLTVGASVMGILTALGVIHLTDAIHQAILGLVATVGPVTVYTICRTWRKI